MCVIRTRLNQLTPVTPKSRLVLRQTSPMQRSPIDFCPMRCAATTTMTGLSIPWCCSSTSNVVSLCDDYNLLFPVVWILVARRDDIHDRTTITCNVWQKNPDVRRRYWPVAKRINYKNGRSLFSRKLPTLATNKFMQTYSRNLYSLTGIDVSYFRSAANRINAFILGHVRDAISR